MEILGSVYFESCYDLRATGAMISDRLLAKIPFSDEIPGLCDEVPAIQSQGEVLGLTFVLHGGLEGHRFHFSLEANGRCAETTDQHATASRIDIGPWLAELVRTIPELRVVGCSPIKL